MSNRIYGFTDIDCFWATYERLRILFRDLLKRRIMFRLMKLSEAFCSGWCMRKAQWKQKPFKVLNKQWITAEQLICFAKLTRDRNDGDSKQQFGSFFCGTIPVIFLFWESEVNMSDGYHSSTVCYLLTSTWFQTQPFSTLYYIFKAFINYFRKTCDHMCRLIKGKNCVKQNCWCSLKFLIPTWQKIFCVALTGEC